MPFFYIYKIAFHRHNSNHIVKVEDSNGHTIRDLDDIKKNFNSYFMKLCTSSTTRVASIVLNCVDEIVDA